MIIYVYIQCIYTLQGSTVESAVEKLILCRQSDSYETLVFSNFCIFLLKSTLTVLFHKAGTRSQQSNFVL